VNPSSLEARSLLAALSFLQGDSAGFEAEVARVLAVNPRYASVFRVAGEQAAHHYRFDDAVALARRAVALDAEDARARADLGMHLLRTGDEPGAREALDAAFRLDPYDVVTYNLLGLLDTLDSFVTIEDGPIVMRLHPDEAAVLREHALPLARDALRTLSARYGVTPRAPILIEIFPRHDDFAVRNLGLPGMIGALGACFGRVVTLDSPHARPPGTFSWQATLWHEMAHVVTLQLSNQRVPRWLTEGISVYEEQRARPEWGRDMQVTFAEAMERGEVIPLAQLNRGFSDPDTIGLAYYEASLLVEHIVATHGDEGLRRLLRAYADGLDTPEALQRSLDATIQDLQAAFDTSLERRFASIRTAFEPPPDDELAGVRGVQALRDLAQRFPGSYPVHVALAQSLEEAGEDRAAIEAYKRAVRLVPEAVGDDSPRARMLALQLKANDRAGAAETLEAILQHDHTNIAAARQLVTLLGRPEDASRALRAHARIIELDPFDSAASSALGRDALAGGDADAAARWFRAALATGPKDPVAAHCDLAEAYLRLGSGADARKQTLAALEIAPSYARAQDLLLTIVEGHPWRAAICVRRSWPPRSPARSWSRCGWWMRSSRARRPAPMAGVWRACAGPSYASSTVRTRLRCATCSPMAPSRGRPTVRRPNRTSRGGSKRRPRSRWASPSRCRSRIRGCGTTRGSTSSSRGNCG
jgi:tetratricopeptide (TPR) repeat protein